MFFIRSIGKSNRFRKGNTGVRYFLFLLFTETVAYRQAKIRGTGRRKRAANSTRIRRIPSCVERRNYAEQEKTQRRNYRGHSGRRHRRRACDRSRRVGEGQSRTAEGQHE